MRIRIQFASRIRIRIQASLWQSFGDIMYGYIDTFRLFVVLEETLCLYRRKNTRIFVNLCYIKDPGSGSKRQIFCGSGSKPLWAPLPVLFFCSSNIQLHIQESVPSLPLSPRQRGSGQPGHQISLHLHLLPPMVTGRQTLTSYSISRW
jgi:hypothetical protein